MKKRHIQTDKQREIKLLVFSTGPSIFIDTGSFKSIQTDAALHEDQSLQNSDKWFQAASFLSELLKRKGSAVHLESLETEQFLLLLL